MLFRSLNQYAAPMVFLYESSDRVVMQSIVRPDLNECELGGIIAPLDPIFDDQCQNIKWRTDTSLRRTDTSLLFVNLQPSSVKHPLDQFSDEPHKAGIMPARSQRKAARLLGVAAKRKNHKGPRRLFPVQGIWYVFVARASRT